MLCYILQTGADGADEMSVFRDSLLSLRHCFNVSDPNQHTLDTLEQGISSLIERIPYSLNSSHSSSGSQVMIFEITRFFNPLCTNRFFLLF